MGERSRHPPSETSEEVEQIMRVTDKFFEQLESLERRLAAVEVASADPWRPALVSLESCLERRLQALEGGLKFSEPRQQAKGSAPLPQSRGTTDEVLIREASVQGAAVGRDETPSEKVVTVDEILAADEARAQSHTISNSIFEATFVLGNHHVGILNSLLIAFALFMDIAVALLILYLVDKTFLGRQFPTVEEVSSWRATEGHLLANIGPSGASLVSRLCKSDHGLITALDKQEVLDSLDLYLTNHAGLVLTAVMLMVWILEVSQELLAALSFISAVLDRPTGATIIINQDDCLLVGSVSCQRKVGMCLLTLLRLAKAGWLLLQGAWWIAVTITMTDLILNAVALAFVLELDTMFAGLLTFHTKTLLADLQPLPQKRSLLHGYFVPAITFGAGLLFAGYTIYSTSIPLAQEMHHVKSALCGGPQDFVYGKDIVGLMWAAPVEPFSFETVAAEAGVVLQAVNAGVANAAGLRYVPHVSKLQSRLRQSTQQITRLLTGPYYANNGCDDFTFETNGTNSLFAATSLRRVTGDDTIVDCAGARQYCDGQEAEIVRTLCPDTCGCPDPLSGLFLKSAQTGCDIQACQSKRNTALHSMHCQDKTPEELRASAAWNRYWERWLESEQGDEQRLTREPLLMTSSGCAMIATLTSEQQKVACKGNTYSGSVAGFCSATCQCKQTTSMDCPFACN